MVKKPRKKIFLFTALLSGIALGAGILLLPPTYSINLSLVSLPLYYVIFVLIFLFLYSLTAYLFRSFIHGILVGLFPIVYLTMRLNQLTSLLFFVLLAGIFITLEILLVQFTKK